MRLIWVYRKINLWALAYTDLTSDRRIKVSVKEPRKSHNLVLSVIVAA